MRGIRHKQELFSGSRRSAHHRFTLIELLIVKTIRGRTWDNMQDWRGTANGHWSADPELKKQAGRRTARRADTHEDALHLP
jgi:hypothetical protein